MRLFWTRIAITLVTIASIGTTALANIAKPPSGTALVLKVGESATIVVGGTMGCKFDTVRMSGDPGVATVEGSSLQKSSHKIIVKAVSVGSTTITILTANGSIPQCQGFMFQYPVTVLPNPALSLTWASTKLANASKAVRNLAKDYENQFKSEVQAIQLDYLAGNINLFEAMSEALLSAADIYDGYVEDVEDILDELAESIAARQIVFGLLYSTYPITFAFGGCGALDKFYDKAEADFDKGTARIHTNLKKVVQTIDKEAKKQGLGGAVILVPRPWLALQHVPRIVVEVVPAPPDKPKKPLRVTWTASGRLSQNATSRLVGGGTADPIRGDVTVEIRGPGGFTSSQTVSLDNKGRWKVTLPAAAPGEYVFTATQTDNGPVTRSHMVL